MADDNDDVRVRLIRRGQIAVGAVVLAMLSLYGDLHEHLKPDQRVVYIHYTMWTAGSFVILFYAEADFILKNNLMARIWSMLGGLSFGLCFVMFMLFMKSTVAP